MARVQCREVAIEHARRGRDGVRMGGTGVFHAVVIPLAGWVESGESCTTSIQLKTMGLGRDSAHLAISSTTNLARYSGDRRSGATPVTPMSRIRLCTAGLSMAWLVAPRRAS